MSSFVCQGHRVKFKITGTKKASLFCSRVVRLRLMGGLVVLLLAKSDERSFALLSVVKHYDK